MHGGEPQDRAGALTASDRPGEVRTGTVVGFEGCEQPGGRPVPGLLVVLRLLREPIVTSSQLAHPHVDHRTGLLTAEEWGGESGDIRGMPGRPCGAASYEGAGPRG